MYFAKPIPKENQSKITIILLQLRNCSNQDGVFLTADSKCPRIALKSKEICPSAYFFALFIDFCSFSNVRSVLRQKVFDIVSVLVEFGTN